MSGKLAVSVGGGGGETDTGVESGITAGETDDVFKIMDAERLHARNQGVASSAFCRRLVR